MRHFQTVQQFRIGDFVFIKEVMAILIDRHTDVFALCLCLARTARGEVHLHPFHMHLAQAHHHEARQQKEHDVDQRDDLDPRLFVRYG